MTFTLNSEAYQRHCMPGPSWLRVNPFEGDRGDMGDRVLSDRIVGAAKVHFPGCGTCGLGISKGEAHRVLAAKFGGKFHFYRWCQECTIAMAMAPEDGGENWTHRVGLHRT